MLSLKTNKVLRQFEPMLIMNKGIVLEFSLDIAVH